MWVLLEVVEFFVDRVLFEIANVLPLFGSDPFALGDVNVRNIKKVLAEKFCSPPVS